MRTTITLEPLVAERLKEEARLGKKSFKQIVNEALARGLDLVPPVPREPYRIKPHTSTFVPGIDPGKLNQLADDLETTAFLARPLGA